jgi:hypothetical protein
MKELVREEGECKRTAESTSMRGESLTVEWGMAECEKKMVQGELQTSIRGQRTLASGRSMAIVFWKALDATPWILEGQR